MEALIGKNYWGFFRGELGSLITAGQSNGGGAGGGALVQFGVGMWKIGTRGSGTNLMGECWN